MAGGRLFGLLAAVLALALTANAGAAQAQVSATLSLDSDYRLRGVSVTGGVRPVVSASLSYDHPSGLYAGATVIGTHTRYEGIELVGHTEYLGVAFRGGRDLSFEIGGTHQDYTVYGPANFRLRYNEVYLGVTRKNLTARIYYSPDYVAPGSSTLYATLDGVIRPAEKWRVNGHAGLYAPLSGAWPRDRRVRADFQLGLAREFPHGELRAAFVTAVPAQWPRTSRSHPGMIVGASVYF
jgi:uncharacterized protein (TIGR02001 family)